MATNYRVVKCLYQIIHIIILIHFFSTIVFYVICWCDTVLLFFIIFLCQNLLHTQGRRQGVVNWCTPLFLSYFITFLYILFSENEPLTAMLSQKIQTVIVQVPALFQLFLSEIALHFMKS